MVSQKIVIQNLMGMDLDSAGVFCKEAMKYKAHISFDYAENSQANAKSMLSVLGAGIQAGEEIELICDGEDEKEALAGLIALISNDFRIE